MKKEGGPNITLGIRGIAHLYGCSERTVRRLHKAGAIPTFQTGGATSPIRARRVEIERDIKRKGKR